MKPLRSKLNLPTISNSPKIVFTLYFVHKSVCIIPSLNPLTHPLISSLNYSFTSFFIHILRSKNVMNERSVRSQSSFMMMIAHSLHVIHYLSPHSIYSFKITFIPSSISSIRRGIFELAPNKIVRRITKLLENTNKSCQIYSS